MIMVNNLKVCIPISSVFKMRARCSVCGGKPSFTYAIRLAGPVKTPQEHFKITEWIKNFIKEEFSVGKNIDLPSLKNKLRLFNLSIDYKGFSPKIHYCMKEIFNRPIFAGYATCSNNHVSWIFLSKPIKLETKNSKGKYNY